MSLSRRVKLWLGLVIICFLGGCSTFMHSTKPRSLLLLPTSSGPVSQLLKQRVMLTTQGYQQEFIVVIRIERKVIKSAALMPTGQQLYLFEYNGSKVKEEISEHINIAGSEVLAIQQLVYWPIESIKSTYTSGLGWGVIANPAFRQVAINGSPLLSVNFHGKLIEVIHHQKNYRMEIETMEKRLL